MPVRLHRPLEGQPKTVGIRLADYGDFVFYATQSVEVVGCAMVPLCDELPPPPPEPWVPSLENEAPNEAAP